MNDKLKKAAQAIIVAIENFDLHCKHVEYTDTDEVWQLFNDIRNELMEALHETEDDNQGESDSS